MDVLTHSCGQRRLPEPLSDRCYLKLSAISISFLAPFPNRIKRTNVYSHNFTNRIGSIGIVPPTDICSIELGTQSVQILARDCYRSALVINSLT